MILHCPIFATLADSTRNESRADEREKLHDETGELAGGQALPFFSQIHVPLGGEHVRVLLALPDCFKTKTAPACPKSQGCWD